MTSSEKREIPDKTPVNLPLLGDVAEAAPVSPIAGSGVKQPRQVRSEALLHGDRELQIIHGDEIYRLSVTRQGKLILHK